MCKNLVNNKIKKYEITCPLAQKNIFVQSFVLLLSFLHLFKGRLGRVENGSFLYKKSAGVYLRRFKSGQYSLVEICMSELLLMPYFFCWKS